MRPNSDHPVDYRRLAATYGFLLLALVIECVVFDGIARFKGRMPFLSTASLINVLNQSVEYGILAVGMTFVILTGGIDLSVGSVVAFSGIICAKVVASGGDAVWWWLLAGWAAALAAGLATGGLSSLLITRFAIPPFIATLALMSSLRGLGQILARGQPIADLPEAYTTLGRYRILGQVPIGVIVLLVVFAVGAVILNRTRFGRHVLAVGGNEESARLSGVSIGRVKWAVYSLCSGLTAIGGVIGSSKIGSGDPNSGVGYELGVIAAVVVGGTSLSGGRGTIGGTFFGLLIVSVLGSGLNWIGVQTFGQQVILGVVILAAVLLDQLKRR